MSNTNLIALLVITLTTNQTTWDNAIHHHPEFAEVVYVNDHPYDIPATLGEIKTEIRSNATLTVILPDGKTNEQLLTSEIILTQTIQWTNEPVTHWATGTWTKPEPAHFWDIDPNGQRHGLTITNSRAL